MERSGDDAGDVQWGQIIKLGGFRNCGLGAFQYFHPSLPSGRGERVHFSEILKIIFEGLSITFKNNEMFAFCFRNIEIGFKKNIVF